jgi:hypothetical protein
MTRIVRPRVAHCDKSNPGSRSAQGVALVAARLRAWRDDRSAHAASDPDPDALRLASTLAALESDPALAERASLERYKARQALAALQVARSRDRDHALFLAESWVQARGTPPRPKRCWQQGAELDRERDQILLEASRREAADAQREADRLRQQQLVREEEAAREARPASSPWPRPPPTPRPPARRPRRP